MKWRSVHDTYRKKLAKRVPSGFGRKCKRPYYLAHALCFLRPLMDQRPTGNNLWEQQSLDEATDTEASALTISLHSDEVEAPKAPPAASPPPEETPPPAAPSRTQPRPRDPHSPSSAQQGPFVGRLADEEVLDYLRQQKKTGLG
ncbi:protein TraK-like [Eleutherodactylus coqui]|uniref:protein TraK-like n=1 Tax=Eleutherodactylus coqui TaxID=57060 RepID=UPI003462A0F7